MTRLSLPTIVPMLLLPCLLAAPATAQVPAVQQDRTTATPGETYEAGDLYLPTSKVFVHVGKTGFGHEHGVIGAISQGRLLLGATHDAGELVFDMTSFVADTDAARRAVGLEGASSESTRQQVNANMRGVEVLNVTAFPTARFVIDSATEDPRPDPSGIRRYRISGNLTLQSQTRPVTFMAEVDVKNGWNRVRGAFKLKQTDFGMKPYTKAFGAVGVADEMIVRGELWVAPTVGAAQ